MWLAVLPVSSAPGIIRSAVLSVHVEDGMEHTLVPWPYFLCSKLVLRLLVFVFSCMGLNFVKGYLPVYVPASI